MRQATSVSRDTLLSLGTCFGKFTKSGKFRLHITALDYVSQYAKVWVINLSLPQTLKNLRFFTVPSGLSGGVELGMPLFALPLVLGASC